MKDDAVIVRIIIVGDSGAGKTSLLVRYTDDKFTPSFISTVGIDFRLKTIQVGNKNVKVQIFDTAGQERFHTITQAYYRNADGALLVYDITHEASFNHIRGWVKEMNPYTESTTKILVGNKSDLESQRAVTAAQGGALAREIGYQFMETSALNGTNVDAVFESMINLVLEKKGVHAEPPDATPPVRINPNIPPGEGSKHGEDPSGGGGCWC